MRHNCTFGALTVRSVRTAFHDCRGPGDAAFPRQANKQASMLMLDENVHGMARNPSPLFFDAALSRLQHLAGEQPTRWRCPHLWCA
jgi:hypothetical protein